MFWGVESFEDTRTGVERTEAGCLFVFQYQITRYHAREAGRVQASVDKVATELSQSGERVVQMMTLGAAVRRQELDGHDSHR